MKTVLRHILGLVVSLALALLGPGAVAHTMGDTGKTMLVICGSEGAETIWINAEGNPVEPDQTCADCPECTEGTAKIDLNSGSSAVRFPACASTLVRLPAGLPPTLQPHLRPASRAPPPLVPVGQRTERRVMVPETDCPHHV